MGVLTFIDLLRIQNFIFMSNRLSDILGGSWLVEQATDSFIRRSLPRNVNVRDAIALAGGGNATLCFDSMDQAKEFASRYTRLLLEEAPGLDAAICHREYMEGNLLQALREIQHDMFHLKHRRRALLRTPGIGVTESCRETHLPAVEFDRGQPISATVAARRRPQIRNSIESRWSEVLRNATVSVTGVKLRFPRDLDDMGRTEHETSMMGVIHVDGNDVGTLVKDLVNSLIGNVSDSEGLNRLKQVYEDVDQMSRGALCECIKRVCNSIRTDGEGFEIQSHLDKHSFGLKSDGNDLYLPLRPIVSGGDDLTIVCDARIALDMAETALAKYHRQIRHVGWVTACGGVLITHTHTPFIRAYEKAEALCNNAKRTRRTSILQNDTRARNMCYVDWHIETVDAGDDITQIRNTQYRRGASVLTCRPYPLGDAGDRDGRTWYWFSRVLMRTLQSEPWAVRRTKIYDLAESVREGRKYAESMLEASSVLDKGLTLPNQIKKDGYYQDGATPIIDAVELQDIYYCLERS